MRRRASPTFRSWRSMIQRCDSPRFPHYADYGGSGIAVCERWRAFENFLADMGKRPDGMTLDRIDGAGNYEPVNCRWATQFVQVQNSRAAKLSVNDVNEIRGRLEHGERQSRVARRFGVGGTTVANIRRRISWPNVP